MRKNTKLFLLCGLLVLGVQGFAQQNQTESKNSYVENMQQKFQQAYEAANTQFQKQYPKPTAPVIPAMPEIAPPPPAPAPTTTAPAAPQYTYQAPKPATPTPNIYVAPKNIYQ